MKLSDTNKVFALSAPAIVGLLILGYFYCNPALMQIPNAWNVIVARYLFVACFLGGAITSIMGLVFIKAKWEVLDQFLKTIAMVVNLGWLGTIIFIAIGMHHLSAHH